VKFFLSILLFWGLALEADAGQYVFNAALVGFSMDYREYDANSQILDSEKSDFTQMMGVDMGVSYMLNAVDGNYAQMDLSLLLLAGQTDYKGAYLGSGAGYGSVTGTTDNTIVNVDASYLYNMLLFKRAYLLYGAAFGYREWERGLSKEQVEVYSWLYLEPKAGIKYLFEKNSISAVAGYKYGISPEMTATGIKERFELGGANTLALTLKASYSMGLHSQLFLAYVYENQIIDKSNIVYGSDGQGYLEPDSETYNQYIKLGVAFKY
jgi:hypothetical protein